MRAYCIFGPRQIQAGDTVAFSVNRQGYSPVDGWSFLYVLTSGETKVDASGVPSGSAFNVTLSAKESAKLTSGVWSAAGIFSKGLLRYTLGSGAVEILADPANPRKSANRQIADNLLALIQGRAMPYADVESQNIQGQQIIKMSSDNLRKWLSFFEARASAEDDRAQGGARGVAQQYFP